MSNTKVTLTTKKLYQRKAPIDNVVKLHLPPGTTVEAEEFMDDYYEVTTPIPITDDRTNRCFYISGKELREIT